MIKSAVKQLIPKSAIKETLTLMAVKDLSPKVVMTRMLPSIKLYPHQFETVPVQFAPKNKDGLEVLIPTFVKAELPSPADFLFGRQLAAVSPSKGIVGWYNMKQSKYEGNSMTIMDADLLLFPAQGNITAITEFGEITVKPQEFLYIPRGCHFSINTEDSSSGLYFENYTSTPVFKGQPKYPKAKAQHAGSPLAHSYFIQNKGSIRRGTGLNPFNVLAWEGNYAPAVYSLIDTTFTTYDTLSNLAFTLNTEVTKPEDTENCPVAISRLSRSTLWTTIVSGCSDDHSRNPLDLLFVNSHVPFGPELKINTKAQCAPQGLSVKFTNSDPWYWTGYGAQNTDYMKNWNMTLKPKL